MSLQAELIRVRKNAVTRRLTRIIDIAANKRDIEDGIYSNQQAVVRTISNLRFVDNSIQAYYEALGELEAKIKADEQLQRYADLNPTDEFSRLSDKGTSILESTGIDLASATQPIEPEALKERIIRVMARPEWREAMSKNFSDESIEESMKRFPDMTLTQIARSFRITQKAYDMLRLEKDPTQQEYAVIGEPVTNMLNNLIASSSISEEQALTFAQSIVIDQSAKNALKKSDYAGGMKGIAKLQNDIADLYRLTGGRINVGRLTKTPRDGRAYYTNSQNYINVGSGLDKATLWHELSHSIEYNNPEVLQAVKGFLADRLRLAEANGSGIKQLKRIYPNGKYRRDEIAIEDSAISHYVTKIYTRDRSLPTSVDNIRSSEVMTMGIEYLSDPMLAGKLINKDPNHVKFVLGVLADLREKQ